ncbi:hypothetical protein ACFQFG_13750 [Methylobacterium persicinum]
MLAGLHMLRSGTVRIGPYDLATLPRTVFSRGIAFAGIEPVLFPGSIRDNLLYGLRIKPLDSRRLDFTKQRIREAVQTGNPWTASATPGSTSPPSVSRMRTTSTGAWSIFSPASGSAPTCTATGWMP